MKPTIGLETKAREEGRIVVREKVTGIMCEKSQLFWSTTTSCFLPNSNSNANRFSGSATAACSAFAGVMVSMTVVVVVVVDMLEFQEGL